MRIMVSFTVPRGYTICITMDRALLSTASYRHKSPAASTGLVLTRTHMLNATAHPADIGSMLDISEAASAEESAAWEGGRLVGWEPCS